MTAIAHGLRSRPGLPRPTGIIARLALALTAVALGCVAVISPLVALGGALFLALAVAVVADVAVGVTIFTFVSFAGVLALGPFASAVKLVGIVLVVSWVAAISIRGYRQVHDILREQPAIVACGALLVLWSAVSVVWAQSTSMALGATGLYVLDLALFPIIYGAVRTRAHLAWFAWAFVAGAALSALYGAVAGLGDDGSRLAGTVGDPNETAASLVAALALALALAGASRPRSAPRALALLAALGSLAGIAATGSRGGLIALGAAVIVAIVCARRHRTAAVLCAVGAALVLTGWFTMLAPSYVRDRVGSDDSSGRLTIWTVAVRTIDARPVLGVGSDNFQKTAPRFLLQPGATKRADLIVDTPKVAHSIYLEIWADLGIVGVLLFGGLLALSLRCALRAAALLRGAGLERDELLARGLVVAIVGMLAASVFISDVWSKQLWLLLAAAPAQLAVARRAAREAGVVDRLAPRRARRRGRAVVQGPLRADVAT